MGKILELDSNEEPPSYSQRSDVPDDGSKYSDLRKQIRDLDQYHDQDEESDGRRSSTSEKPLALSRIEQPAVVEASSQTASTPHADATDSANAEHHKHHHFGQRLKNKLTGTTHEEREEERAKREALYRRAYEAAPAYPAGGYGGFGYGYGGYGYGGYGYGYGGNALLWDSALLGGFGGLGYGLWI